jgi:hypothetical protein
VTPRGLTLTAPGALLDDWRDFYDPRGWRSVAFYTSLHGDQLEEATKSSFKMAAQLGVRIALSSFSAAQWLAPYTRTSTTSFFSDGESTLPILRQKLKLEDAARGQNVVVTFPHDSGVFLGALTPSPDITCTGAIQTYLDLSSAGERGREAADYLRREKLQW